MKECLEWRDPRTGVTWLVRVFTGSQFDSAGRSWTPPRMLTFRQPIDPSLPVEEMYSALIEGDVSLASLGDHELAEWLDAATGLVPRATPRAARSVRFGGPSSPLDATS